MAKEKFTVTKPHAECNTRNTITLTWKTEPEIKHCVYSLQIKDRIKGWITVYWGYLTRHTVKDLGPEECYYFKLKAESHGQIAWSPILATKTADDQIPVVSLYRAIQHGKPQLARKILNNRPGIADIPERTGMTSLIQAIKLHDLQMVTLLLNAGADMNNVRDGVGRTPLMVASFLGYTDIVRLLSERGANWEIQDRSGCTAVHYAVDNSQTEPLEFALEHGVNIESRDSHGWTPLMRGIIMQSNMAILELLLEHGADAHTVDKQGETSLIQAVLSGRHGVVKLLLNAGVDIDKCNVHGNTALDIAQGRQYKEIARLLVFSSERKNSEHK